MHVAADGSVAQIVLQGFVNLLAGEHAHDTAVVDHREAFVAQSSHAFRRLGYGSTGAQRLHAVGHDLGHGDGRLHVSLQQFQQPLLSVF